MRFFGWNFALENRFFFRCPRKYRTVSKSKASEVDFLNRCQKSAVGVSMSEVEKSVAPSSASIKLIATNSFKAASVGKIK